MSVYKDLTREQIQFIIKNHYTLKYQQIADELHISKAKVVAQTQKLQVKGILGKKPRRINWTEQQEKLLIKLVNSSNETEISIKELSNELGKTQNEILAKIRQLHKLSKINLDMKCVVRDNEVQYCTTSKNTINSINESDILFLAKTNGIKYISYKLQLNVYDLTLFFHTISNEKSVKLSWAIRQFLQSFTKEEDIFIFNNFKFYDKHFFSKEMPNKNWKHICNRAKLFGLKSHYKFNFNNKKTDIEMLVAKLLKDNNIEFFEQKKIKYNEKNYYIVDFLIKGTKIIVEANGDYWHGNPKLYSELNNLQKKWKINEDIRLKTLTELGYTIFVLWEYDLKNDSNSCIKIINDIKAMLP